MGDSMRILFASWPAYGHLLPMVPLIRAAQRAGHDVVVSSGSDLWQPISALAAKAHRSGVTLAESYARMPEQATISELPASQQPAFAARHLFGAGAVDRARDVLDLVQTWRPDLIVHDTLEFGSAVAAVQAGIPSITHGYGPTVPGTEYFAAAIGAALAEAGLPDVMTAVFAAPYVDICPPGVQGADPNPWSTVCPLRPSPGEVPSDAAEFIDFNALPHPDSVYLTLGTIMNRSPQVFAAALDGCARLPVNVIVTTGPGVGVDLLGSLPSAVVAAPFLPQAAVLPRCTAVVSHAGAGTMLGALCHGLPQLCLPQGTDQPFNTAALMPTGAALALDPDEITADAIEHALGRLLTEGSFRDAADRVRQEIEHMPTASAVLEDITARTQ
jgi:UDP:flavonoid glycosyltransferase YjiC (YdhE family)